MTDNLIKGNITCKSNLEFILANQIWDATLANAEAKVGHHTWEANRGSMLGQQHCKSNLEHV